MIEAKGVITGNINPRQSINGVISTNVTYVSPEDIVTNKLVEKLPEPSEQYRGHFRMIEKNENDTLYICLKVDGVLKWVNFSSFSSVNKTKPILGEAILDMMVLG